MPYKDPEKRRAANRKWYRNWQDRQGKTPRVLLTPEERREHERERHRRYFKTLQGKAVRRRQEARERERKRALRPPKAIISPEQRRLHHNLVWWIWYRKLLEAKWARLGEMGCVDCGEREGYLLRQTKLGVLCANCHQKRTVPMVPISVGATGDRGHRARVAARLMTIKAERGCSRCPEKDPRALAFHHRNPETKKTEVSALTKKTLPVALKEAEKCDVVCFNCHIREHRKVFDARHSARIEGRMEP